MKASEVTGRKVLAREGGQEVGKIKDVLVDASGRQVLGFVVSEGVFSGTKVVAWKAIQAIGPNAVVIDSAASVVKADDAPDLKAVLDRNVEIRGLPLQTTQGKDLGKIDDFRFDETTGVIEGYEISGGMFSRRSFLPTPPSIELGKDLAFVAPEAEATIEKA